MISGFRVHPRLDFLALFGTSCTSQYSPRRRKEASQSFQMPLTVMQALNTPSPCVQPTGLDSSASNYSAEKQFAILVSINSIDPTGRKRHGHKSLISVTCCLPDGDSSHPPPLFQNAVDFLSLSDRFRSLREKLLASRCPSFPQLQTISKRKLRTREGMHAAPVTACGAIRPIDP